METSYWHVLYWRHDFRFDMVEVIKVAIMRPRMWSWQVTSMFFRMFSRCFSAMHIKRLLHVACIKSSKEINRFQGKSLKRGVSNLLCAWNDEKSAPVAYPSWPRPFVFTRDSPAQLKFFEFLWRVTGHAYSLEMFNKE